MIKWPAVILFVGMSLGIYFQEVCAFQTLWWSILLGAFFIMALIFHFFPKRQLFWLFQWAILMCAIAGGALLLSATHEKLQQKNEIFKGKENALMIITPLQKQKTTQFYKKIFVNAHSLIEDEQSHAVNAKVLLQFPLEKNWNFDYRYRYFVRGKLRPIKGVMSPAGFDYAQYMLQNKVLYQLTVDTMIVNEKMNSFSVKNQYHYLIEKIDDSPLNGRSKEIIKALTLADRTEMNPESVKIFSLAGIIHLFAISGLHITLLFALLYYIFMSILGHKRRSKAIVLSLIILVFYASFIQFPTSVTRAIIMLILYYGFQILQRPSLSYHSLAMAGMVILCINPYQLFNVGFQLSFAAVFFIFWLYPAFKELLKKWNRNIRDIMSVTLSAQLGTLPLSLYYFHQMSWMGFFLNLLIMPFAGVLVLISFVVLIVICFFPGLHFIFDFYNKMTDVLYTMAATSAHFNQIFVQKLAFSKLEMFSLFALVFYLKYILKRKQQLNYLIGLVLGCVFLSSSLYENYKSLAKNELTFYNQYKNTVISIKKGNELHFFSKQPLDENFKNYTLEPYWLSTRKPKIEFHSLNTHKLIYENQVIWLVNDSHLPENCSQSDILLLQQSPKIDMQKLKNLKAETIVLDGSNYPDYVEEIGLKLKELAPQKKVITTQQSGYYQLAFL